MCSLLSSVKIDGKYRTRIVVFRKVNVEYRTFLNTIRWCRRHIILYCS